MGSSGHCVGRNGGSCERAGECPCWRAGQLPSGSAYLGSSLDRHRPPALPPPSSTERRLGPHLCGVPIVDIRRVFSFPPLCFAHDEGILPSTFLQKALNTARLLSPGGGGGAWLALGFSRVMLPGGGASEGGGPEGSALLPHGHLAPGDSQPRRRTPAMILSTFILSPDGTWCLLSGWMPPQLKTATSSPVSMPPGLCSVGGQLSACHAPAPKPSVAP